MAPAANTGVAWQIQTAIYDRLVSDPDLAVPVFDHVPEGTPFPYITIGEATVTPIGAHDRFGARTTVTLHVWSVYHGRMEALGIVSHLMRLLDHQGLEVDNHHTVSVRHEQTVTMTESDTDVRHAAVRFAIETEHLDAA